MTSLDGGPATTEIVAVPDFPSDVAVTVTDPGTFAVANPFPSIVSTATSEVLHDTGLVRVVPSLSLMVAVSCLVVTTGIGERFPAIVTVSTRGCIITEKVPTCETEAETFFALTSTVLPAITRHA